MKRTIVFVLSLIILLSNSLTVLAKNPDKAIMLEGEVFVPLDAVFEVLGTEGAYEEETDNIYFEYLDKEYVCYFKSFDDLAENKYMYVCEKKYINSVNSDKHLYLNDMAHGGYYIEINNEIYLHSSCVENFLDEFYIYTFEIDIENCKIKMKDTEMDIINIFKAVFVTSNNSVVEYFELDTDNEYLYISKYDNKQRLINTTKVNTQLKGENTINISEETSKIKMITENGEGYKEYFALR